MNGEVFYSKDPFMFSPLVYNHGSEPYQRKARKKQYFCENNIMENNFSMKLLKTLNLFYFENLLMRIFFVVLFLFCMQQKHKNCKSIQKQQRKTHRYIYNF